jgi:hypothetical protein
MRLCGYLIRLTRGYTDGGMDSRTEETKRGTERNIGVYCYQLHRLRFFSANVRSAVHVSMGEAGVTFAL